MIIQNSKSSRRPDGMRIQICKHLLATLEAGINEEDN